MENLEPALTGGNRPARLARIDSRFPQGQIVARCSFGSGGGHPWRRRSFRAGRAGRLNGLNGSVGGVPDVVATGASRLARHQEQGQDDQQGEATRLRDDPSDHGAFAGHVRRSGTFAEKDA